MLTECFIPSDDPFPVSLNECMLACIILSPRDALFIGFMKVSGTHSNVSAVAYSLSPRWESR
jgi:hypothetical protein